MKEALAQTEKEPTKLEHINNLLANLEAEINTFYSVVNQLYEEFNMERDLEPEEKDDRKDPSEVLEIIIAKIQNRKDSIVRLRGLISQFKSRI